MDKKEKIRKRENKLRREYYLKNLEKCKKYNRDYMKKKYKDDEEYRNYIKAYTKKYRNTKKGKAYVKEYNARPEVRERNKKWREAHPHHSRDWARKKKWKLKK